MPRSTSLPPAFLLFRFPPQPLLLPNRGEETEGVTDLVVLSESGAPTQTTRQELVKQIPARLIRAQAETVGMRTLFYFQRYVEYRLLTINIYSWIYVINLSFAMLLVLQ